MTRLVLPKPKMLANRLTNTIRGAVHFLRVHTSPPRLRDLWHLLVPRAGKAVEDFEPLDLSRMRDTEPFRRLLQGLTLARISIGLKLACPPHIAVETDTHDNYRIQSGMTWLHN